MAKKKKVITIEPKIDTDTLQTGNTYMFHNTKVNVNLFVTANGFDDAMNKFDLCMFGYRGDWKIFMECGQQPIGDKNEQ
tara:strand:- start:392 stop:628 length:237 start_codon:yes stop_codon:yes gene_type:complete